MIKKIIGLLLLASISHASVTKEEVRDIANKLNKHAGNITIHLSFDDSDLINGMALCGNRIIVTKGAMKAFNHDEMMFMIGHEIGHIKLGHTGYKLGNKCYGGHYIKKKSEIAADMYAIAIMKKGKYNACHGGVSKFKLYLKIYGNGGGPKDDHPSNKFRLQLVKDHACHPDTT